MVKAFLAFILSLAFSASTLSADVPKKLRLSQKDVAEIVLRQGHKTAEANLTFLQERLKTADARKDFDWNLSGDYGYQFDKSQPQPVPGSSYKSLLTNAKLSKKLITGTTLGLSYQRTDQRARYDFVGPLTPTGPTDTTTDVFGLTFEQSLLNNSFGISDRAKIRAADETYRSAAVTRADNLEQVVLDTIKAFWDAYVAKETFREALASRERYRTLVAQVRRKSGYGYANPGELSQVEAEFEGQEQNVKNDSTDYLAKLETLTTLLNMPSDTEVEFVVDDKVPPVPKLSPVEVEKLRPVRAQQLKVSSANDALVSSHSTVYPMVNLVANLATSGYDENSGTAFSTATSGSHPKYYFGVKAAYNFGSDYQNEDILNKKATKELEETRLARTKMETTDALAQAERSVQAKYAIVQSAIRQNEFREKAVKELTRTYGQGRTDIKLLIDAINNQFTTEVALSRAIGDYEIALNQWAAVRDELIPDGGGEKK